MLKAIHRDFDCLPLLVAVPLLMLAALPAHAQIQSAAAGCGADQIRFHTKHDKHAQPPQPEPGEALVYFIEDDSDFNMQPPPTTRIGIDGQWVGATHDDSYFVFAVAPGMHHLCASWQAAGDEGSPLITSAFAGYPSKSIAMLLIAQPGGVYYFIDKNFYDARDQSAVRSKLGLTLVASAQAAPLLSKRRFTVPRSSDDKEFLGGLVKK